MYNFRWFFSRKHNFLIPEGIFRSAPKNIEVTKNPIKQVLFSISMPKNVLFAHFLKCQILGLGWHFFVSEMVVSKNAGLFYV